MKDPPAESVYGPAFWVAVIVGWGIIAFGIFGVVSQRVFTHPRSLVVWVAGSLIAHDAVIAPLVFATGIAVRRVIPLRVRWVVHFGLAMSGVFVLVSIPMLGRFGAHADNPTVLAGNYAIGLLIVLAVVWAMTAIGFVWAWRRQRI